MPSKRVFRIGRLDRTAPRTIKFLQKFLGGRLAPINDIVERLEVAGLVPADMVDAFAAAQAGMGERHALLGDLEQIAVADAGLEGELWHVVAQRRAPLRAREQMASPQGAFDAEFCPFVAKPLPLRRGPVLDDVPGRIEADI